MFGNLLVTPTLLDSFDFANNAPNAKWKAKGMKDFVAKLRRESIDYPYWVQKGMDFENQVYKVCRSNNLEQALTFGSPKFQEVVMSVHGGQFQQKLKRTLKIGDETAFFFGFSDVEHPDLTIDIKTTINYKGKQKYLDKNQHLIYLWINKKKYFKYIVVEWFDEKSNDIVSVNDIDYENPGQEILEAKIVNKTKDMWNFIRKHDLWNDYYFTFSKNK